MPMTEIAVWNADDRWSADPEMLARLKQMILSGDIVIASTPIGMLDWPQYRDDRSESLRLAWETWQQQTVKET